MGNSLAEKNTRLAYWVFQTRWAKMFRENGLSREDGIAVAIYGLCKAARKGKYKKALGKFSTYAYRCIQREIVLYVEKNISTICLPTNYMWRLRNGRIRPRDIAKAELAMKVCSLSGKSIYKIHSTIEVVDRGQECVDNVDLIERIMVYVLEKYGRRKCDMFMSFAIGGRLSGIGSEYGICRERVRQIYEVIASDVRERFIEDYMEA